MLQDRRAPYLLGSRLGIKLHERMLHMLLHDDVRTIDPLRGRATKARPRIKDEYMKPAIVLNHTVVLELGLGGLVRVSAGGYDERGHTLVGMLSGHASRAAILQKDRRKCPRSGFHPQRVGQRSFLPVVTSQCSRNLPCEIHQPPQFTSVPKIHYHIASGE